MLPYLENGKFLLVIMKFFYVENLQKIRSAELKSFFQRYKSFSEF